MFGRALILFLLAIFAFVLVIAGVHYATSPVKAAPAVDTAIVFVVDVSGSMKSNEVQTARQAHAVAMMSTDVLSAIQEGEAGRIAVAYVEFGDRAKVGIDWMIIAGPDDARLFAALLAELPPAGYLGGQLTAVGAGLLAADELMGRAPPAARLVVDIAGDGTNTGSPYPKIGREALLSRGVVINAMPVLMESPDVNLVEWYTDVIVGGPGHFVMPIAGLDKMPMALRSKIVLEIY